MVGTSLFFFFLARTIKCHTKRGAPSTYPPIFGLLRTPFHLPGGASTGGKTWDMLSLSSIKQSMNHSLSPPPPASPPYTESNLTYERPPTVSLWVVLRSPASGVLIRNADSWAQLRPTGTQAGPLYILFHGIPSAWKSVLHKDSAPQIFVD